MRAFRHDPMLRHIDAEGSRQFHVDDPERIATLPENDEDFDSARRKKLEKNPAVERIFYADRDKLITKEAPFRQIQHGLGLKADEILIVADRPMLEIRAGNELGMHTVGIRHGEFIAQEPVIDDWSRLYCWPISSVFLGDSGGRGSTASRILLSPRCPRGRKPAPPPRAPGLEPTPAWPACP
jgi:HAD-hyrolase-like